MKKFSKIEKDNKTFQHVIMYYNCIMKGDDYTTTDIKIQQLELKEHLERNHVDENKNEECDKWIKENHKPFRKYINTLKVFSLFMFMNNQLEYREKIPYQIFEKMVEAFNEHGELIMDTIMLE